MRPFGAGIRDSEDYAGLRLSLLPQREERVPRGVYHQQEVDREGSSDSLGLL